MRVLVSWPELIDLARGYVHDPHHLLCSGSYGYEAIYLEKIKFAHSILRMSTWSIVRIFCTINQLCYSKSRSTHIWDLKRLRNIYASFPFRNDGCVAQNMRTSLMHVDRRRIRVMGKLDEVKVNCLISQKHKDPLQRRWCGSWTYPRARSISSGQDTRTRMKKSHILH